MPVNRSRGEFINKQKPLSASKTDRFAKSSGANIENRLVFASLKTSARRLENSEIRRPACARCKFFFTQFFFNKNSYCFVYQHRVQRINRARRQDFKRKTRRIYDLTRRFRTHTDVCVVNDKCSRFLLELAKIT